MCGVDGMVIDDGTVLRLADDRFLVLTTTGGAAKILDWMEEWLQTEWPQLRVHLTSVTEQWATFPVVGPRSRDVIGAVFPDVDVSKEAFPFMTWRDTSLEGVSVRLARISFSGELAYEVYVSPWHAVAVWQRLVEAGRPYGITPYGTETMHVLRAEKGYPIIGQDTDGTVTPQDLGMSWAISKKKPDFVGKRSFARVANQDPLRKHLVGLLPVDRQTVLPEGSQIVEFCVDDELPPPPVPMLGHVTSSYRSAELGRPFALALVKGWALTGRRNRPRTRQRHPRPGRSHRLGAGRSGRSPSRWLSRLLGWCAPTRWRRGATRSPAGRTRSASPWSRSSRRSTSGSAPSPSSRRSGWGSTSRRSPTPGCRPPPGTPSGSGPTSGC
jgi:glycine cleavage system aminomethyltransferase T